MGLNFVPIWEYFAIVAPELLITDDPGNLLLQDQNLLLLTVRSLCDDTRTNN